MGSVSALGQSWEDFEFFMGSLRLRPLLACVVFLKSQHMSSWSIPSACRSEMPTACPPHVGREFDVHQVTVEGALL